MLTYKPADAGQIEEFLNLLRIEAGDYLDHTAALMQMTWEQFAGLGNTVGQVWGVYRGGDLVGFYWIEERDRILLLTRVDEQEGIRVAEAENRALGMV